MEAADGHLRSDLPNSRSERSACLPALYPNRVRQSGQTQYPLSSSLREITESRAAAHRAGVSHPAAHEDEQGHGHFQRCHVVTLDMRQDLLCEKFPACWPMAAN
jgi:hypothetical protein